MQPPRSHTLAHGAIAGGLAGLVVAIWFLVLDVVTAQALRTPVLLAGALLGAPAEPSALLIASYTIIHFSVFLGLGIGAAVVLREARIGPGLLLGGVFGLAVLDGVHYGALLLTGTGVLTVLPTVHVLAANLLGGMTMMAYLHRALHAGTPLGIRHVRTWPLLERGLVTGAVGAAAVAIWMLALDLAAGRGLFTPAALGSLFFLGAQSAGDVQVTFPIIAAYTLLHLCAFAIIGTAFEWSAAQVERAPAMWLVALLTLIVLEALFIGTAGVVGQWVLDALGLIAIVTANLVAILAMGGWVWIRHPRLKASLAAGFAAQ